MFRKLGKSKLTFLLAILFGLSLFFIRGQERYSNFFNSDNVVASVSGTPISTSKFLRAMQMNINQYSQIFGKPLTSEEIIAFQIHSIALGQLVNNAVFENEFDNKNYIIDETVVANETKKRFPNLYNADNKLNQTNLNSFLSQQSLKIDDLVRIVDYEARSKVFDKLFFSVNYPKKIESIINKYNNHTRNVDLIKFNINEFKLTNFNELDISIENEEISNFFNQNINSYINPEKRDISYILIDKNSFKDQFTPSKSEIQNYYNNNKEIFLEDEKRDFIQFNFKSLDEANKFRDNITPLQTSEIINFANSNNIFFNEFSKVARYEVLDNLSKTIFNTDKGKISNTIESPLAHHIIIINEIYPENQKTLDQSEEQITITLQEVELDGYFLDLKNKVNQQILDGFSLSEIATNNKFIIKNIKDVEINKNNQENDSIINEVIIKGFSSNLDFVSDLSDIDNNTSIIINVDQITKAKPYELSEVFEIVSNDWIKSTKIKSIETKIEKISNDSKSIKDISDFVNFKIINTDIKLNDSNYPSLYKNKIFSNELKDISLSVVDDDIYISETNKIYFPNDEGETITKSLLSELRASFGSEIIKNKNISTNDNLIQALISQY